MTTIKTKKDSKEKITYNTQSPLLHIDGTEVDLTLSFQDNVKLMHDKYFQYGQERMKSFISTEEVTLKDKDFPILYYYPLNVSNMDTSKYIYRELDTGIRYTREVVYYKSKNGGKVEQKIYLEGTDSNIAKLSLDKLLILATLTRNRIYIISVDFKQDLDGILYDKRVISTDTQDLTTMKQSFDQVISMLESDLSNIDLVDDTYDVDKWHIRPGDQVTR